jgi:hypothetical protein
VTGTYLALGIEHILLGIDHLLFGLLWLIQSVGHPVSGSGNPWRYAERFSVSAAYLVGTVAMFWVFERTYSFWG